jgi:hypothetical protein
LKKTVFIFMIIISLVSAFFFENYAYAGAGPMPETKIIVYYFYGAVRCPTCHKLEQYSKEAIESNFKNELLSGKLEFKAVNLEDRGNEHFVSDYQLYTKSLVISLVENGKEVKSKNLVKIWEYVGSKDKFFNYVTSEISGFLNGA